MWTRLNDLADMPGCCKKTARTWAKLITTLYEVLP